MTEPNIFNQLLLWPILNILIAFYKAFSTLVIPGAFGLAIISATSLIRLLLYPLTTSQLKSAQKMNALKPHMDKLSQMYKNDKQRLQAEQLKLYKEMGINPAAGCLPLLLQFPILIALYNVFFNLLGQGNIAQVIKDINKIIYFPFLHLNNLDLSFFGLNLTYRPSDWQKFGWWLLLIPVITALLQYWQTKLMTPALPVTHNKQQTTNLPAGQAGNKKEEKKSEDMGSMMQKQMSIMMPLMIGFFAYSFPVGLSLYWNTFTVFGIIQQAKLNKANDKK